MPRQSRIDAPGAIHHVIGRGINRQKIFLDDDDRRNFLDRLATLLTDSGIRCPAWAMLDNHFHLLLRTGTVSLSTLMRRLLTGFVISHNRRHNRSGPLFQNRYKSILCQEYLYLLELVRYIHLNPLRSGIVSDMAGPSGRGFRSAWVLQSPVRTARWWRCRPMAALCTRFRRYGQWQEKRRM